MALQPLELCHGADHRARRHTSSALLRLATLRELCVGADCLPSPRSILDCSGQGRRRAFLLWIREPRMADRRLPVPVQRTTGIRC